MLKKIANAGNIGIRIVTGVLAAVFLVYAFFTLWDIYRTQIEAFASYDMLKYRPNIEEEEPPYLDDLLKINPDTAGWVTVYGTNIDYPVFQGKSDTDYLNKNAYGEFQISGSIFMSVLNKKDFSDPYTLLYGHHMENGSMFGDIDKFKDKDFFNNKNEKRYTKDEGVLIMQEKVYNLKVFAVIETDAYDNMIYRADKEQAELPELISYAKEKAVCWRDVGDIDKILAMSTCDGATTAGRSILLCKMELRTEPLPTREEEPLPEKRKAIGHPMAGTYFAALNLFMLILTVYAAFPIHLHVKNAVRKIRNRKDKNRAKGKDKLTKKARAEKAGMYILLLISACGSVVLFYLTEDPHKPMMVTDRYTIFMLLLLTAAWTVREWMYRKENRKGQDIEVTSNLKEENE